jgi:hypothetical protein
LADDGFQLRHSGFKGLWRWNRLRHDVENL